MARQASSKHASDSHYTVTSGFEVGAVILANIFINSQDKWARLQQPIQSNATTRRFIEKSLALRGIEADFGTENFSVRVSCQMRTRTFKKQPTQPL